METNTQNQGQVKFSIYGPMVSASGEAAKNKYHLHLGKSGKRWVVADLKEAAEHIYVDGEKGSQGMAGRTLTFELVDGSKVDFIGPWKTTADNLFSDTGIDFRGNYLTKGIVALKRERCKNMYEGDLYSEILHLDVEPVMGVFDRVEKIAQGFADDLKCKVFVGVISAGGGFGGTKEPRLNPDDDLHNILERPSHAD